ncbi:hypothetical protein FA10DRAFT_265513 [Acaromyces ingoldii]|uniref:DUF7330 domain-containing protein n=1 Tax=Acaromyces ingoldii TaxID=215250 RepID=A0A316YSM7_9BASI|nr:hypothetical protein FA10DRAFT_265513 [Acaromyces ingoldii]PWN91668.1 hypothetical protein FA10DRAFT_265513 [Acaromyces ingoldii]
MSQPPVNWTTLVAESSRPKPVNHIYITQNSQSIKGKYTISPYAEDVYPPVYDLPPAENKAKNSSSAGFVNKNSAISVMVWIEGNKDLVGGHQRPTSIEGLPVGRPIQEHGKPVTVYTKSHMGRIKIVVPQYTVPRPLHIQAKSSSGDVIVHIPPTFRGMLSFTTDSGSFKPSASLNRRLTPLGEQKKHRGVFKVRMADWIQDDHIERGDSAELITHSGTVYAYEAGEESEDSSCVIV